MTEVAAAFQLVYQRICRYGTPEDRTTFAERIAHLAFRSDNDMPVPTPSVSDVANVHVTPTSTNKS